MWFRYLIISSLRSQKFEFKNLFFTMLNIIQMSNFDCWLKISISEFSNRFVSQLWFYFRLIMFRSIMFRSIMFRSITFRVFLLKGVSLRTTVCHFWAVSWNIKLFIYCQFARGVFLITEYRKFFHASSPQWKLH